MFSSSTNLAEHHSYGAIGYWSYTSCVFDDCCDVYSYVAIDIVYMHWSYASCRFNEHWDVFLSLLELGDSWDPFIEACCVKLASSRTRSSAFLFAGIMKLHMMFGNVVSFAFINTMLTCAYCGKKMHVINFTLLISASFFFHTAVHIWCLRNLVLSLAFVFWTYRNSYDHWTLLFFALRWFCSWLWCSSKYYWQHSFLFYLIPKECLGFVFLLVTVSCWYLLCSTDWLNISGMQIFET